MKSLLVALGILFVLSAGALTSGCAENKPKASEDDKANVYINAASSSIYSGDTVTAFEYLRRAEEINPKNPEIYHSRALAYIVAKDIPSAIESARRALKVDPLYSKANNTLGKLLMDSGKSDEALPHLIAAAHDQLNREAYKAYTNLGILYYNRMHFAECEESLDRAIELAPNDSCMARYYRGHLDLQKKNFTRAIDDYDQATRRFCADFAEAHLALGIAYERSGHYEAARRKYLEIRDHFANSPIAEQAMDHLKYLP